MKYIIVEEISNSYFYVEDDPDEMNRNCSYLFYLVLTCSNLLVRRRLYLNIFNMRQRFTRHSEVTWPTK